MLALFTINYSLFTVFLSTVIVSSLNTGAYVHGWTVVGQCIRARLHGRRWYDSKDGIGRVESGTETENDSLGQESVNRITQEQLSRRQSRAIADDAHIKTREEIEIIRKKPAK